MPEIIVKVDASKATIGLAQFRLGIQDRRELMQALGTGQLKSIYTTFDEQGPGWPPLSPNSLRWNRKYTAAHKLLQNTGQMRNSITAVAGSDSVSIGTNLLRARVHQFGFSGAQNVAPYSYTRQVKGRDTFGKVGITNKLGKQQTVRRKLSSGMTRVSVKAFARHINIPARPFVVFRPEDPQRMVNETSLFIRARARQAGLEAN